MRVITFSRYFPANHPRKGEPTFFVEKIWAGLADNTDRMQESVDMDFYEYYNGVPKWHTIRAGHRWRVGDFFSPRFWSGKPYASKQSLITEPIEVKKIWTFRISNSMYYVDEQEFLLDDLTRLACNDGLDVTDFEAWFSEYPKKNEPDFVGQIICWNENIDY